MLGDSNKKRAEMIHKLESMKARLHNTEYSENEWKLEALNEAIRELVEILLEEVK